MKIYLVGGAVRDQLLRYPVVERDWVVTGATPKLMLEKGYRQVGRDFPVFLHPDTHEEYALARTERKSGLGYYGFDCDASSTVTLEEDLKRRDLTINAIAMDEAGQIIDPFQGVADLKARKLRHVSPAFVEDPVRVLRVARFAARYHHLGFTLADETRRLLVDMVSQGELQHLVAERVWQEFSLSLGERNPEVFISTLRTIGALKVIFPEIDGLFGVPNPPKYHPEIDTGIHTLEVLAKMVNMSADPMLRFAALVHDLGKGVTAMEAWPAHHGHEKRGIPIIEALCARLRAPVDWRRFASLVCKFHLHIHRFSELRANTIVTILEKTDAFRQKERFDKLLSVCAADGGEPYTQAEKWRRTLQACLKVTAPDIIREGFQGPLISQEQHARRVAVVKKLLPVWKHDEK